MGYTFPNTPVMQTFTGADGTVAFSGLTSGTYALGTYKIVGNEAAAAGQYAAMHSTATVGPDCEVHCKVSGNVTSPFECEPALLLTGYTGGANYTGYALPYRHTNFWGIYRYINGARVTLISGTLSPVIADGDEIGLRRVGYFVEAWRKPAGGSWGILGRVVDTTHVGQFHATVYMDDRGDDSGTIDNMGYGTLVRVPFPATPCLDDFNRANETVDGTGDWTLAETYWGGVGRDDGTVVSNQMGFTGDNAMGAWQGSGPFHGPSEAWWELPNGLAQADGGPTGFEAMLVCRYGANQVDGYSFEVYSNGTWNIWRMDNSVYTVLRTDTNFPTANTVQGIGIRRNYPDVETYVKIGGTWRLWDYAIDTTYDDAFGDTDWKLAYWASAPGGVGRVDNFGGGEVRPTFTEFPLTGVLDNFNRANGAIGSDYEVQYGGITVASNEAVISSGTLIYWMYPEQEDDQEVYVTLPNITNPPGEYLEIRSNVGTGVQIGALYTYGTACTTQHYLWDGTATRLIYTGLGPALADGMKVGMRTVGDITEFWYWQPSTGWRLACVSACNWLLDYVHTPGTYTRGPGIYLDAAGATMDDLGGGGIRDTRAPSLVIGSDDDEDKLVITPSELQKYTGADV